MKHDLLWCTLQYIWEDNEKAVKEWLEEKERGLEVMMKDSHGYAPIHYAAKFNRPKIMQMLLKDGGAGMLLIKK